MTSTDVLHVPATVRRPQSLSDHKNTRPTRHTLHASSERDPFASQPSIQLFVCMFQIEYVLASQHCDFMLPNFVYFRILMF